MCFSWAKPSIGHIKDDPEMMHKRWAPHETFTISPGSTAPALTLTPGSVGSYEVR
jgi:hypothetical protein